jgi:hypothetical protein
MGFGSEFYFLYIKVSIYILINTISKTDFYYIYILSINCLIGVKKGKKKKEYYLM